MTNTCKNNQRLSPVQMVAGVMPNDSDVEFNGIPETKKVLWIQHGCVHYFKDLSEDIYRKLEALYLSDAHAMSAIAKMKIPLHEQVELYTYYIYGDLDTKPDVINGELQPSENTFDSEDCISLEFDFKNITIGENILSKRDLMIIEMIRREMPDKAIAEALGIGMSTLDFHKHNLYEKAGVKTKAGLIEVVNKERIFNLNLGAAD